MDLNKWIRNQSPETIRWGFIFGSLFVLIVRAFSDNARSIIDVVAIIIFALLLLAILRPDIKDLVSQMKGVGFPGTQIPVTNISQSVQIVEEKYRRTLEQYGEPQSELKSELNQKFLIDEAIEEQLSNVAEHYQILTKDERYYGTDGMKIADYLIGVDIIGKDIYQLSKTYLSYRTKDESQDSLLIRLGRRILRLISAISKKFKALKILSSASEKDFYREDSEVKVGLAGLTFSEITDKEVTLYTSINLLDDKGNGYPIVGLTKSNVRVFEHEIGHKVEVDIKTVSRVDDGTKIYICLLIDCSASMNDYNKIQYAKEAAISLVHSIFDNDLNLNVFIAIYPVSTNYNGEFFSFAENRQWSSSKIEIEKAINSLIANGDTPLIDAIKTSLVFIDDVPGYTYIICISDGNDNISGSSFDDLFRESLRRETPIYTVGYGEEEYLSELVQLSKISKAGDENVGSFMRIHPNDLSNVFGYLSSVINHAYKIVWEPSKYEPGLEKHIEIVIDYEDEKGITTQLTYTNLKYRMK